MKKFKMRQPHKKIKGGNLDGTRMDKFKSVYEKK